MEDNKSSNFDNLWVRHSLNVRPRVFCLCSHSAAVCVSVDNLSTGFWPWSYCLRVFGDHVQKAPKFVGKSAHAPLNDTRHVWTVQGRNPELEDSVTECCRIFSMPNMWPSRRCAGVTRVDWPLRAPGVSPVACPAKRRTGRSFEQKPSVHLTNAVSVKIQTPAHTGSASAHVPHIANQNKHQCRSLVVCVGNLITVKLSKITIYFSYRLSDYHCSLSFHSVFSFSPCLRLSSTEQKPLWIRNG